MCSAAGARISGRPARPRLAVGSLLALAAAHAICLPVWLPWLGPRMDLLGLDDALAHLIRAYHLAFLLERHVWWSRWVPDMFLGYGYPLFNFYAPGSYYLCWLLGRLLALDYWDAFRAGGVVAALAGLTGMYALATRLWRRRDLGVLAAVCFAYLPYVFHANLYIRGDLPELLGLALIPWLLLAIHALWHLPGTVFTGWPTIFTVAAGSAIVLVHNLTTVTAAALATVWIGLLLVTAPGDRRLARVLVAGCLAAGVTAGFWLPAVGEASSVQLDSLWETGHLDWRTWLVDPAGRPERDFQPGNRQTRTGLFDLHWRYPNQMIATPKPSLAQLALFAAGLAAAGVVAASGATAAAAPRRRGRDGEAIDSAPPDPLVDARENHRRRLPPEVASYLTAAGGPALARVEPFDCQARVAASRLTLAGGMALAAAGCWFLTLQPAAPIWDHVAVLRFYQFPSRLFGPIGICLPLAATGALSAALPALAARHRLGRVAGHAMLVGLGAFVIVNGGRHDVPTSDAARHAIDGQAVLQNERSYVDVGTTGSREFLPRDVRIPAYTRGFPRFRSVLERLYPEGDWSGGLLQPLGGRLSFRAWQAQPLQATVVVANDGTDAGAVGIRQLRYPGWRAWIDGRPTALETAPYSPSQQASPGFIVVDVPPGVHTLSLAFGPTRLRALAVTMTVLSLCLALGLALGLRRPPAGRRLLWRGVAWALLSTGLAAAWWLAVRPAFYRAATLPVGAPAPDDGIWRAAWSSSAPPPSSALIVNLAEAVARGGPATVRSPLGPRLGPDAFVDVRYLTVSDADDPERDGAGTSTRQWLYLHPPSSVAVDVALPDTPGLVFQAALAIDPAVWQAPTGDGVRFRVSVSALAPEGSELPLRDVLDLAINPRAQTEYRRWVPVEADLSPWRGRTVRLTLTTEPRADTSFDWSGWGNPVIAVRHTARTPPAP